MPAECTSCLSLLSELEPVAGASLALNLAYLGLQRFRYREKIREHANREIVGKLEPKDENIPDNIKAMMAYKNAIRLANLDNGDNQKRKKQAANTSEDDVDRTLNANWWFVYSYVFETHNDRRACFISTFLIALVLFIGVGQKIGHFPDLPILFSGLGIAVLFYIVFMCFLLPIIFAFSGQRVVDWANKYWTSSVGECVKAMQGRAQTAQLNPPRGPRPEFPRPPGYGPPAPPSPVNPLTRL